ncbi:MAG: VIT1/CCC1 transporter family protein [Stappiaceae bacterium]
MQHEHEHTTEAIVKRLVVGPKINYLRDWVYGGIDGAVTTFAIVAGAIGAELSTGIVLVLGIANLLADGFSMAAANYAGTKAEIDDYNRLRAMEERHIDLFPEGEREEIRQIYKLKGYRGSQLERLVSLITGKKENWIDTMLNEEHGLSNVLRSPVKSALATFAAFVLCGGVPLLPFVIEPVSAPLVATCITGAVFFGIGSVKSHWSTGRWYFSGLETTLIGMSAASIAWGVGYMLQGFAQ